MKRVAPISISLAFESHSDNYSLGKLHSDPTFDNIDIIKIVGNLEHAFCTETRPYNQGARLTAYELVFEKIPSTLIVDSAVSLLMTKHKLAAVVVGADRVVANGDTANKIGTYQLAITGNYRKLFLNLIVIAFWLMKRTLLFWVSLNYFSC